MIMRYRWYKLQLPNGEDSLLHQLALTPLSTESSFGFSFLASVIADFASLVLPCSINISATFL